MHESLSTHPAAPLPGTGNPAAATEAAAVRPTGVMTDFCVYYPRLDQRQKGTFREVVTRLLAGHILTPGSAFTPDPHWMFVERFWDLIEAYLEIAGWRLEFDRALGVARVVHTDGDHRASLGKLESLAFCMLRLIYHEQKLLLREDDRCQVTVGELRERLIHAGAKPLQVSVNKLRDALKVLARFYLISVERGFQGDDEAVLTVSPVVERVLTAEQLEIFLADVKARRATEPDDEEDEDRGEDAPDYPTAADERVPALAGSPAVVGAL